MTTRMISYYLNEQYIEGWDYYPDEDEGIDIEQAAQNLTNYSPGDVLTGRLYEINDETGWREGADEQSIELEGVACAYCGRMVSAHDPVPAVTDDVTWQQITSEHETNCEWATTRAHRADMIS